MTRGRWREHPDAEAKEEQFFAFIGRYQVAFQWIEDKLDEIILLARGHDNWRETQRMLANKSNRDKVEMTRAILSGGAPFRRVTIEGWYERAEETMSRLHAERDRRNSLIHAGYVFDFIAAGGPVVAIKRQRGDDDAERFTQEELTDERQHEILIELAALCELVGRLHVQLVAVREE